MPNRNHAVPKNKTHAEMINAAHITVKIPPLLASLFARTSSLEGLVLEVGEVGE
jgi:hypothetical protein